MDSGEICFGRFFSLFSGCALHSNIGVLESNQPTVQIGMDVLPETIYDAIENLEDRAFPKRRKSKVYPIQISK